MITAKFLKQNGLFTGFIVSGHAGTAKYGQDIVCAGVSSAVMLALNTITEFLHADAKVRNCENKVGLMLTDAENEAASRAVIFSLEKHLELLNEQYGCIEVKILQR